jgi:hypothetical protein
MNGPVIDIGHETFTGRRGPLVLVKSVFNRVGLSFRPGPRVDWLHSPSTYTCAWEKCEQRNGIEEIIYTHWTAIGAYGLRSQSSSVSVTSGSPAESGFYDGKASFLAFSL